MLKVAQRHAGGVLMKTTRRYWNIYFNGSSDICSPTSAQFCFYWQVHKKTHSGQRYVCVGVHLLTIIVGSTLHSSIRRGQKSSQALTILLENKTHMCITNFCRPLKNQNVHVWHIIISYTSDSLFSNTHTKCYFQTDTLQVPLKTKPFVQRRSFTCRTTHIM